MPEITHTVRLGDDPTEYVLHELRTPGGILLSELHVSLQDARGAINALTLLRDKFSTDPQVATPEQQTIAGALYRDGIILFSGCLGDPKKGRLDENVLRGSAEDEATLKLIGDLRDTYAAHAFGPLRQSVVAIITRRDPEPAPTIYSVSTMARPPDVDALTMIIDFMSVGVQALESQIKELNDQLAKEVRALSDDQVRALPVAKLAVVENHQLRMSRKAIRALLDGSPVPQPHGSQVP